MAKVLSTEKVSRRTLGAIAITGMFGRTSFKTSAKFPLTEAADAATSKSGQTPENILPNVQWQVWSALAGAFWNENDKAWRLYCVTKMNREGTGTQYPIVCDRFDVLNNNPTFYTKNTQQLKNGDLVLIEGGGFQWGYDGPGFISTPTAVRVVSLVPDTSFVVVAPLGGVTPRSVLNGVTARPICPGYLGQIGNGNAADGWKKTPSMTVWADDFAENTCAGAIRTMGVRKDQSVAETLSWTCPPAQLPKYQGRVVSFGALVYPKSAQGRRNTWRPYIFESVSGYHHPIVDAVDETSVRFSLRQ